MALIFEHLGEKELFEILSTYLKDEFSHDHENGCLNDYLLKCGSIDSIKLFGYHAMVPLTIASVQRVLQDGASFTIHVGRIPPARQYVLHI